MQINRIEQPFSTSIFSINILSSSGNYNYFIDDRNVVKAFYTAGIIYDVLLTFGELSEEATDKRKYAKFKAAYIHNCLKNGETPVPGPPDEQGNEGDDEGNGADKPSPDENVVRPPDDSENKDQPPDDPITFTPHPTEINGIILQTFSL